MENDSLFFYLKDIERTSPLTRDEEYDLAVRAKNGDERAKEKLLTSNLRFVVTIAKKYQNRGLSLNDLISEGNLGLITAIEKFEPERGIHFISYAIWWIKQAITKAIGDTSRPIRLPMNVNTDFARVKKEKEKLEKNKDNVSLVEIADNCKMSKEKVAELLNYDYKVSSLQEPLDDNEETILQDLIPSKDKGPEDLLVEKSLTESIDSVINKFEPREKDIIIRRFGLHNTKALSLNQMGDIYGISKERVRQIEKKLILQMRNDSQVMGLRSYIA